MLNIKEYYSPGVIAEIPPDVRSHLVKACTGKHGIIEVKRGKISSYFGVSDKDVLEKSLAYFNGQHTYSAKWFYFKDLLKSMEAKNEEVLV